MKKNIKFFTIIVSALIMTACNWVNMNPALDNVPTDGTTSKIMLKSAGGYNSQVGVIYVQQNIGTGLKVQSLTASPIVNASWTIDNLPYAGIEIYYKFLNLGTITLSVTATFQDGTKETRNFSVVCVADISTADPIRYFVTSNGNGTWNVLLLFSKERIKGASDTILYYNGLVTNWVKTVIPVADKYYVINSSGLPVRVNDVGKYAGVNLTLSVNGLYNIALIHSVSLWADLSGSAFTRQDNPGLAWFNFTAGVVTPAGDNSVISFAPGLVGDNFFRFDQIGDSTSGKSILYFKLDAAFTNSAYVVREQDGGSFSTPISLLPVTSYTEWGKIEITTRELLGKVSGFRYGPDISYPNVYSANMLKTLSYDPYFKEIRMSMFKL